jgi:stage II sporulation protein D
MPSLRSVALFTVVGLAVGCGVSPALQPSPRTASNLRVRVVERGVPVIRRVDIEDYATAAALSEVAPASGEVEVVERMLEVQTVIGRTYALGHLGRHAADGFDLCSTTHCQLYDPARLRTSRWAPAARDAARRTRGQVLWFNGSLADALFHADCGGHISAATDVWGGTRRPYLTAHRDDDVAADTHTPWEYSATLAGIREALTADVRARVGTRLESIAVLDRDAAGRVQHIVLKGASRVSLRGVDFREMVTRAWGERAVRSTRFDLRIEGSRVDFTGMGFGHGVGLCQAGAFARIRAGAKLRDVLQRYYPGTKLIKAR